MDKVWTTAGMRPNTEFHSTQRLKKIQSQHLKNSMKSLQYYTNLWGQSRFQSKKGEYSVALLWFKKAIIILEN